MLDVFLAVPGGFKTRLFRLGSHILRCWVFQVVFPGYCQTTVNSGFREALQAPRRKHAAATPIGDHEPPVYAERSVEHRRTEKELAPRGGSPLAFAFVSLIFYQQFQAEFAAPSGIYYFEAHIVQCSYESISVR
jgi:hypothetical protein